MIKTINLNDWVESGGGARGISYFHKDDPTLMVKMSNMDIPIESWEREIFNSQMVYGLGLPTPKPGTIVTDGKRYGLMYQRIQDKVSYARAVGESSDEEIDALGKSFAQVVKQLHSTVCKKEGVRNIKDFVRKGIRDNKYHSEETKESLLRLLNTLPDDDKGIHGDLHFGNVIMAKGKSYMIDLDNFSYGYYKFDMAMFVIISRMNDVFSEEANKEIFHCTHEQTMRFYQSYLNSYFGKPIDIKAWEDELAPYVAMRIMSMENEVSQPYPRIGLKAFEYIKD